MADIKCWTNRDGVRECGMVVPPEYAQQETRTINERGITIDVQKRAKTKEELAEERRIAEEEAKRKAEEERKRKEQQAYDRVLLSTFLTEEDILAARDRKLTTIDGTIDITQISIDKLEEKLAAERKRAANFERRGQEVPPQMQEDIDTLEQQIANKRDYIAAQEKERAELIEKYEADRQRFRQLKGLE
jgi:hypothetical protein